MYAELHRARRVDGVIILEVRQDDDRVRAARDLGIAYICAGRPADSSAYVAIDIESGMVEAMAHLIVLGHERVGLLLPPLELTLAAELDTGYRAAIAEAGLDFNEQLVIEAGSSESEGYAAAADLLALPEPPTALVAGSAALAWGTMHAVHEAGRRVGEEVALIVFDDPPAAAHVVPPLTAVRQPIEAMGRELARGLVAQIEEHAPPHTVLLSAQLLVRRSCGEGARS
jgi:LacI family transcriptional regulator